MKILVVDDEKLLVKGVKFNLENEGYEVTPAYDGVTAVELAKKESFDLIVMDVMMPGLSGGDACMQIREFSDVPIIMLTARSEDSDKLMGFACGADGHAASLYGLRIPVDGRHPPRAGDSSPPLPERGSGAQYPPRFAVYPELPVGIQRPDILEVVQQRGSRPPPGAAAAHHHVAVHVLPRRTAAAEEQVVGVPPAQEVSAAVDDEVLVVAAVVGCP